ncbi:MAG TPA: class I SAM-dependent methyltransferase, partial [Usitatibacter sp.]|nr:class I SAM-dependent methyltransferase [Usitatibacter sp.]
MKITPEYIELNRALHATGTFGMSGGRWRLPLLALCEQLGSRDILDYGCGQRTLQNSLPFPIRNYDPCIPGLDAPPEPADIVVCTDVLEHVEPECIEDVLEDLKRVTRDAGLFCIATRPAERILADGRNAHLIQQPRAWWMPRLERRFR